ncbi:MAG: SMC-Scp complex subunit ScpB [Planctomycetes bacterium]|nr:SMC-Scp complex subunit ScpB [Planctomycetota bacterium]
MTDADELETDLHPFADDSGVAEIDALYRQALAAMDSVEAGVESVRDEFAETAETDAETNRNDPLAEPAAESCQNDEESDEGSRIPASGGIEPTPLTAERILEAALFVGGVSLTTKKLRSLLRGDFSSDFIEKAIGELNQRYAEQRRPYEIVFGEGGYRMELKPEYSAVRNRVFGLGPREIRLTQDALEVLSLVAYRQPVTPDVVETTRGKSANGLLRQLLRRELISLDRDADNRTQVEYRTTKRFLQLFGLSDLDELPQADDLHFK